MSKLKMLIISVICLITFSCSTNQPTVSVTGADKDIHGCKASAGYRWSNLKKECIRIFELPVQLVNADNSFSAGVIISQDTKQAEVLTKDGDYILTKQSENSYINDKPGFFLKKVNDKWEFGKTSDGKTEYFQSAN